MDDVKFKSHAEKEFWEKVYLETIGSLGNNGAHEAADCAVAGRRFRMTGLVKPGVKAA